MNNFLKTMEPYLLSEDPFVQHFAIRCLRETYLATPDTLFTALEAFDRGIKTNYSSSILPHIDFIPIDKRGFEELINRIKQNDENKIWYLKLLSKASTDLLLTYKEKLKPFVNEGYLENLQEIKNLDDEGLFMELAEITNELEGNNYNDGLYRLGKRIFRELIDRGRIPQWEIENNLRNNLEEHEYMPYNGIFNVFGAGELRTESVLPELIQILNKDERDIVLEEITKALVKIGTEEVIYEVEKVALNESTFYFSIDILGRIKSKQAEEALLRLFEQTEDIAIRTMIADSLCQHLSIEAIPKVESLIEKGYDSQMLDLEESLYANLMINQINHPNLQEIKLTIEERQRRINERRNEVDMLSLPARVKTVKVGRNEPCPCGSGKKYKKCCMKG